MDKLIVAGGFGVLMLGLVGCQGTTAVREAAGPTVAFAAPVTAARATDGGCTLVGMPRVVATRVVPQVGIEATATGGRAWLRFATLHQPRALEALDVGSLESESTEGAPVEERQASTGPVEVDLASGARLVAWTTGSMEGGMHVRAVTVDDRGRETGLPLDLGYEGSAIGRPAVAIDADGRGVFAFIESNGADFHLVAVRARCDASR